MLKIDYDYTSKSGIDGGDGLMGDELNTWDLSSKEAKQVYKLAGKFVLEKQC